MPRLNEPFFSAVRRNEDNGEEWIDLATWDYTAAETGSKVARHDAGLPTFARNHPVVRIEQFCLTRYDCKD